jgi:hypothetical protein
MASSDRWPVCVAVGVPGDQNVLKWRQMRNGVSGMVNWRRIVEKLSTGNDAGV